MRGATPPFPNTSSWRGVHLNKAQGQLYFTLLYFTLLYFTLLYFTLPYLTFTYPCTVIFADELETTRCFA
jgi:predicted membrane protein